jgi:hypothetical protein
VILQDLTPKNERDVSGILQTDGLYQERKYKRVVGICSYNIAGMNL